MDSSNALSQLAIIRKQRQRDFFIRTHLPSIIQRWKFLARPKIRLARAIMQLLHRTYFQPPINITSEQLSLIPPYLRIRFKLNNDNLIPLQLQSSSAPSYIISPSTTHSHIHPNNLDHALNQSLIDLNKTNDDLLDQAIRASLSLTPNIGLPDSTSDLEFALDQSINQQYDDFLLREAIKLSSNPSDNTTDTSDTNIISPSFWVALDMSIYGHNPNAPIIIDNQSYYLNPTQQQFLLTIWNRVNPATPRGIKCLQDYNFLFAAACDKLISY